MTKKNQDKQLIDFFGERWVKFDQETIKSELIKIFNQYFSIFPWSKINNHSVGIDVGSGSGRWAQFVLPYVKKLYCLEPSKAAIEISKKKLSNFTNCEFINKPAENINEIENHSLDFAYSLGVLHHVPDIEKTIDSICIKLKNDATFLAYIYYNLKYRGPIYKILFFIANILRIIISRLPFKLKFIFSDLLAVFFYLPLSKISSFLSYLNIKSTNLPLSFYKNLSFYTLRSDSLDRFGTKVENRFSKDEILEIFLKSGVTDIIFSENEPYWTFCGTFKKDLYYKNKKNRIKNILIVCPYPFGKMASQRLKYEQHLDYLKSKNFNITISSFFGLNTWNKLYKKGYVFQKIIGTLKGYFYRVILIKNLKKYEIIYIHMWVTPFGNNFFEKIYRLKSKSMIYDIEDNILINKKSEVNPLNHYLRSSKKYLYLIKNSDHIITSAPDLNDICINISKKNNCTFITPAFDLKRFTNHKPFNDSNNNLTIGWTGTFSSMKYLQSLENVFLNLLKKIKFKLIVIGNFHYNLKGIDIEMIQWTEKNEIYDLSKIDIGIYPLLKDEEWVYGKSGLKALQYMAMGIPSISTNVGNVKNFISNGKNGFLVDTDFDWESAILKLIKNPDLRNKIGINARKTIEQNYSKEIIDLKYLEVINSIK